MMTPPTDYCWHLLQSFYNGEGRSIEFDDFQVSLNLDDLTIKINLSGEQAEHLRAWLEE